MPAGQRQRPKQYKILWPWRQQTEQTLLGQCHRADSMDADAIRTRLPMVLDARADRLFVPQTISTCLATTPPKQT